MAFMYVQPLNTLMYGFLVMGLICLEIFLNFMLFVLARAYSVVDGSFIIVSDDF